MGHDPSFTEPVETGGNQYLQSIKCFDCSGIGHINKSSPYASQLQEAPSRRVPCKTCSGTGFWQGVGLLELPLILFRLPRTECLTDGFKLNEEYRRDA